MLQSLHVKNLALMEETEVNFTPGLNILTGETGAGKSLLIGSVNLALGGRFDKDMLRHGEEFALVELSFTENEKVLQKLAQLEIESMGDGSVLLSRKMSPAKSVCKINGETVTAKQVKELAEVLIDIHGQHEHQSLLKKAKHLEILDAYAGESMTEPLQEAKEAYELVRSLTKRLEEEAMDEAAKAKEQALAAFELEEIEKADPIPGEDEELETAYRRMVNSQKISESLAKAYACTGSGEEESAGSLIGRAVRLLDGLGQYDEKLSELAGQLSEVENLLSDFNGDLSGYMENLEFDPEDFYRVETRLNDLNRLKSKYGRTLEEVIAYGKSRQELLLKLSDYDSYMDGLKKELQTATKRQTEICEKITGLRKEWGMKLAEQLKTALLDLNFLSVELEVSVTALATAGAKGADEVEFLISTNPGETPKALSQVASGGELSRIMLAIKTLLAKKDEMDALIFDEIDAGISGRTAWEVSKRLHDVACEHQVICITHLPQIAAMADTHFKIEKSATDASTLTDIECLSEDGAIEELARLLGSDSLSEAALTNAREMKKQAEEYK